MVHADEDATMQDENDDEEGANVHASAGQRVVDEDVSTDNTTATAPSSKKRKQCHSSVMDIDLPAGMTKSAYFPVNIPISSKTKKIKLRVVLEEE